MPTANGIANSRSLRTLRTMCVALITLHMIGCTNDPTPVEGGSPPSMQRTVWQGTYTTADANDSGVLTLDLTRVDDVVQGEVVLRSRTREAPYTHFYVKGMQVGDDLTLALDTDVVPYTWQFTLAAVDSGDSFAGEFSAPPWSLVADFAAVKLNHKTLVTDSDELLPRQARGLAFHQDHLWIARSLEFDRRDSNDSLVAQVEVFLTPGIHWTSGPLTSDGTNLVGHLPLTTVSGSTSLSESDIITFSDVGVVVDRFRLGHRTGGLTHDGTNLWSLPISSDGLYRFDASGNILEVLSLDIPDLVDLAFDGTCFWSTSWFLNLLYQIDSSGQVVNVYDLPQPANLSRPVAITFDGNSFRYVVSDLAGRRWLYRFHRTPE